MTLAARLSHYFGTILRERGFEIYRSRSVSIEEGNRSSVFATVKGMLGYDVTLALRESKLWLSCSCPYAETNGHCKHLWATILAASDKSYLADLEGRTDVKIAFGYLKEPKQSRAPAPAPTPPPDPRRPYIVPSRPASPRQLNRPASLWRDYLQEIDLGLASDRFQVWPESREALYIVDLASSRARMRLALQVITRDLNKHGRGWNQSKALSWPSNLISRISNPQDREIISLLFGAAQRDYWYSTENVGATHEVPDPLSMRVLEAACRTGRCYLRRDGQTDSQAVPLAWDDNGPWTFRIRVGPGKNKTAAAVGELVRGEERMDLTAPDLVLPGGLVLAEGRAALLDYGAHFKWVSMLRLHSGIEAKAEEAGELLAALLDHPSAPRVEASPEIQFQRVELPLQPRFIIRPADPDETDQRALRGEVMFAYEGWHFYPDHPSRGHYVRATNQYIARDLTAEAAARALLDSTSLPAPTKGTGERLVYKLARGRVPALVRTLVQNGWLVETEGKAFRSPVSDAFSVTSGIDWFELHADLDFGGAKATLPELLRAIRNGETLLPLSDGTYGLLPEDWIARYAPLAHFGEARDNHVRFRRTQAGLLDVLLASRPETRFDEGFARARDELRRFGGVEAAPQPATFNGQLRDYQREGLGWMEFLRRFGFGGCLADDMGLGKTAQVLAMLEARRGTDDGAGPSMVVMPRSLIFNWKQEARRFTPGLRILDHTGADRSTASFADYDVVLTTYGILRRDVVDMRDLKFDYVVLDEAQAIKNAASESAKAARLLQARHRLALSGTPVENHLGELASLFEFLNPGMLGPAGPAQLSSGFLRNPTTETRTTLARALRPFILRRTKQQVARELPPKTEQTIFCEMDSHQRKLYDELRQFYRNSLLGRVDREGLAKSKIQVLEALLRLRQAACHPGLLDPKRSADTSAKIQTLMAQLAQVIEEGHKVLVFSQFTSLLALVKPLLDREQIPYEYLDGSTTDRQARVERFQGDKACPLFLISLKAGGLGLNLTAAEYVYLLDPWWNPAVEAQAIDRTHRIGQNRQVFAYRLITKDTVEEKVLELQNSKRDLAASIIGEDNSLIRDLKREDLELLLA